MFEASRRGALAISVALFIGASLCMKYDPEQVLWNINQNQTATDVADYWGQWENHSKRNTSSSCVSAYPC